jgi:ATP-binding cassette subfamily B protein
MSIYTRSPVWSEGQLAVKTPLNFLLLMTRPYKWYAASAAFVVICASLLDTSGSYILRNIINSVSLSATHDISGVWSWTAIYIIFFMIGPIAFWRMSAFVGMRWSVGIRATSTIFLASYVTKHSNDYFHKRFAGALGGKIGNTSESIKKLVETFLWSQLNLVFSLITTLALAFITNKYIGILFLLWLGIVAPLNYYLARQRVPLSAMAQGEDTRVRGRIIDLLSNIGAMHDFARRNYELDHFKIFVLRRYRAGLMNWTRGERNRIINNIIQVSFVSIIIISTLYAWTYSLITPGDIVLVFWLIGGLGYRIEEFGKELNEIADRYGEVKEGLAELLDPYDISDIPNAPALTVERGEIDFQDISFAYHEGAVNIVANFSLTIPEGQKVGLVGRSGAGKSTLMKLLLRHYNLTNGTIAIDGQDIAQVTQESLRENISIVPQEPLLFHRTIGENIAYGNLSASLQEIEEASRLAQAHDFINRLPLGYETLVGERGVKLSGGERQRIALARAILKNTKILLLDEATSSLDSESEAAIQRALHVLMEGKTVLAIAHRLSTLREMDRILVLDQGRIIEDGSHEELLQNGGLYAELWSHQSGGYLKEE